MINGKKTYASALVLALLAALTYLSGDIDTVEALRQLALAGGLAGLKHAVSK